MYYDIHLLQENNESINVIVDQKYYWCPKMQNNYGAVHYWTFLYCSL